VTFCQFAADFFCSVGLGLGQTDSPQVRFRKSISSERTFSATKDEVLLHKKLGICLVYYIIVYLSRIFLGFHIFNVVIISSSQLLGISSTGLFIETQISGIQLVWIAALNSLHLCGFLKSLAVEYDMLSF